MTDRPRRGADLERSVEAGILTGMLAAVPMGLLLMLISVVQGRGLFTPAYRIAFILDTTELDTALRRAELGDHTYLGREALLFGATQHFFVAAALGVGFALLARVLRPGSRASLVRLGILYALAGMVLMSVAVLPVLARALALGPPVANLGGAIGWPAFVAAHVVFGAILGYLGARLLPHSRLAAGDDVPSHEDGNRDAT